jgi:hypothetical protein
LLFRNRYTSQSKTSTAPLAAAPAPPAAKRRALAICIALFVAFCALIPFANVPLPHIEAFVPIYDLTLALNSLVTAGFLLVGFSRSRLLTVLVLAAAYFFISLMAVLHMLTVPGLLLSYNLFGSDSLTSAWVDIFRLGGLPLMVIFYALLNRRRGVNKRSSANTPLISRTLRRVLLQASAC